MSQSNTAYIKQIDKYNCLVTSYDCEKHQDDHFDEKLPINCNKCALRRRRFPTTTTKKKHKRATLHKR